MFRDYEVADKEGNRAGPFSSVDNAKASLPQVREWRQDEHRKMGWNGWTGDAPFSPPDYKITFIDSSG
jgi:hypothetical protein